MGWPVSNPRGSGSRGWDGSMTELFADVGGVSGFLPHGYCLAWQPGLLWTMVGAHAVIGISYFSIPVAILYFLRRQPDLKFNWLFLMFALFILGCGTTHLIELVNIWIPIYRADAAVLAVTAGISLATALMLWALVPEASDFLNTQRRTQRELVDANQRLADSMKQLEQRNLQAEESERRFRLTFENAPIGLALVGLDGSWIDVNQVLCSMLGYSEQELLQRSFQDITHPKDLEKDLAKMQILLAGGLDTYRIEKRYYHKQGHIIHIQLDVSLLRDERGQPLHFISQIQDISGRVQAGAELAESRRQLEAGYSKLQRQNQEIRTLGELNAILQSCNSLEEMAAPLARFSQMLFPDYSGALYLMHASRNYLERMTGFGDALLSKPVFGLDACWSLRRGRSHWQGEGGLRCTHMHSEAEGGAPVLCIPVTAHGEVIGVGYLQASNAEAAEWQEHVEQLATMLADRVGIAIANVKLREKLRLQSIRDPLTGLLNRRFLEESMPRELGLAHREVQPLAVLMLDVDHFKRFNDTYGHEAGDQALRLIGHQLESEFRGSDIACRYGGEEFAVVMPRTSLAQAAARAQQVCENMRKLSVSHHDLVVGTITVSIGVAAYPEHGQGMVGLLEQADRALYRAKRAGRDCVVCSDRADDQAA
jgi:diguanylate cyclase (GGDEF)-like protein/PAS domain S-box-containing protein